MMRALGVLFTLASLSASVYAQRANRGFENLHPTGEEQILMGVIGHFGGGFALLGVGAVAALDDSPELLISTGFVLYPLGVAAAAYGLGRAFETDGRFWNTVRGAYLGIGIGLAVGAPLGWLLWDSANTLGESVGAIMVGASLTIVGTLVGAVRGYDASIHPTIVRGLDGQTTPALTLALRF